MDTELGRTVISALSALSGMVIAYRSRSESNKVLVEQEVGTVSPSTTDPWRWHADTHLISPEELDQIVSNAEVSAEAGAALLPSCPTTCFAKSLNTSIAKQPNCRNRSPTHRDRRLGANAIWIMPGLKSALS